MKTLRLLSAVLLIAQLLFCFTACAVQGPSGADGKDGRGIEKMEIVNGELIVTYTDGEMVNLGPLTSESVKEETSSEGLEFASNGDGTCIVREIGSCIDRYVIFPTMSPDGDRVTGIGDRAFISYLGFSKVDIPEGVESIGFSAFSQCQNLTKITFPSTLKTIGTDAFFWCNKLTDVELPNEIESVGNFAFALCTQLKSIEIPDSLTTINRGLFKDCTSLTSIVIGKGVIIISDGRSEFDNPVSPFAGCKNLSNITYNGTIEEWRQISKASGWNADVPATVVHCIDGDVPINE